MPDLSARHLSKRYSGQHVVHDVTIAVRPGEVVGYLGPNGSGKTTTARMLAGLLEPSYGVVEYDGRDVRTISSRIDGRSATFPKSPTSIHSSPAANTCSWSDCCAKCPRRCSKPRSTASCSCSVSAHAADQSIASYSKGMRQKIVISAALLHDPDVVIFDEPETGLDVTTTMMLRHLVRTLAGRGKAILYSSHILEVVEKVCDRILVLHQGEVVADDSIERLRTMTVAQLARRACSAQLVIRDDPEAAGARSGRPVGDGE